VSTKLPVSVEPDESNLDDNNHLEGFDILDEVKDEGADETGKKVDKKKLSLSAQNDIKHSKSR
jgi:hypothetical protein